MTADLPAWERRAAERDADWFLGCAVGMLGTGAWDTRDFDVALTARLRRLTVRQQRIVVERIADGASMLRAARSAGRRA